MKRFLRFLANKLAKLGEENLKPLVITQITSDALGNVYGLSTDGRIYRWDSMYPEWKLSSYSTHITKLTDLVEDELKRREGKKEGQSV